jgi:hypothetical protein
MVGYSQNSEEFLKTNCLNYLFVHDFKLIGGFYGGNELHLSFTKFGQNKQVNYVKSVNTAWQK